MNRRSVSLYLKLARTVKHILQLSHPSPHSLINLRHRIISCRSDINYDCLANEFAKAYWLRNYWKAVYFFEYEFKTPPENLEKITVLGAGSGADSLAFISWLDQNTQSLRHFSVTLIERSRSQLNLAKKLIAEASLYFKNHFDIIYKQLDIRNWRPSSDSTSLIIMSHFLTENPEDLNYLLSKTKSALCSPGQIVVIERERDPVWIMAKNTLANMGITVFDTGINNNYFSRLRSQLKSVHPHYIEGVLSAPKYQTELVSGFFLAWRNKSLETVRDIFTPQAIFDEKPGLEPSLLGLPKILDYWKANPLSQTNINISLLNSAYCHNLAVCAFNGEFDTPKQHIAIRGAINFYIDPHRRQISRLTEYFGTVKVPFNNYQC